MVQGRDYRFYVVAAVAVVAILAIGIGSAAITGASVSRTKGACNEITDKGNDIHQVGTVNFEHRLGTDAWVDECLPDNKHLKQYFCGRPNRLNSISVLCPNGCSEGVCIR